MQIIKCMVSKPGLFDNISLDFDDAVTIVFGRNGSGKSLLAKGLISGIWKNSSDNKYGREDILNSMYMDIDFSLSDIDYYKISNNIDKHYKIKYVNNGSEVTIYSEDKLENLNNENNHADLSSAMEGKYLQDFFYRVDQNAFMNSSFIPSSSDINRKNIIDYEILKKIFLNDSSNFYHRVHKLLEVFGNGNDIDMNLLPEIIKYENILKELDKEIQIIDMSNSRDGKLSREKNNIQNEIDNLNNSVNSLISQKEILIKILQNLNKVDELKKEFEKIKDEINKEQEKIVSISLMKKEIDTLFPKFSNFKIDEIKNLDKLQGVFNEIRNINVKSDDFYFKRKSRISNVKKIIAGINGAVVISMFYILLKNEFIFSKDIFLQAGVLGFGVVANIVLVIMLMLFRGKKELEKLQKGKVILKEKIEQLLEKSKVEVADCKLTEIYELLLQYFEDYIDYTEMKKDLAKMKKTLKEEEYIANVKKKLDLIKKEEAQIKNEINISIDKLNIVDDVQNEASKIGDLIQNIDVELEFFRNKIETKKEILIQIESETIDRSSDSEKITAIYDEKNSVERILKKWKVNQNSIYFIVEILSRAVERSEEKQLRKLVDSTLDKFNHLTGNQYITKINEDVLLKMITENIINEDITPPMIHGLLLSLKISLSDFIIDEEITFPMLIDDPFQFMDDERSNRFRDIISYISLKRQVIIFTHHSGKQDWGNFIEL